LKLSEDRQGSQSKPLGSMTFRRIFGVVLLLYRGRMKINLNVMYAKVWYWR
jgi:hypothetical protein